MDESSMYEKLETQMSKEGVDILDLRNRLTSPDFHVSRQAWAELEEQRDTFVANLAKANAETWAAAESLRKLEELQAKRKAPRPPMNRAERRAAARRNG